ncbi:OmpA family protein [Ensifer aridi]|uniref:OmpA family protein n=1 Tax=Ensifer aridi TaxID=1708715 RepID=UPI000A1070B5|nr:OmpA family protein [Ensifer aridi]
MKGTSMTVASIFCIALLGPRHASAQDVPSGTIIEELAPKWTLKQSALASAGLNSADETFLKSVPARGISIEERQKLAGIVTGKNLPSIDLPVQFASATLTFSAYKQVEALASALNDPRLASARYSLNGHTDAKGTTEYNQLLSEARAASVQDALVNEFGVDPLRLVAVGFGEERPKDADDPEGAIDRRVEVVRLGEC